MRNPQNILICGIQGTGKSTFARDLIERKVKQGFRALVVTDQDDFGNVEYINIQDKKQLAIFEGIRRTYIYDYSDFKYLNSFYNGILVFDDARTYMDPSIPNDVRRILISLRHRGVDIITVAHALDDMPKPLFRYANYLVLYESNVPARERKSVLRKWKEIEEIQEEISNEVRKGNKHYHRIINLQG